MGSIGLIQNACWRPLTINNQMQGAERGHPNGLFSLSRGTRFSVCSEYFYTFLAEPDKLQNSPSPQAI